MSLCRRFLLTRAYSRRLQTPAIRLIRHFGRRVGSCLNSPRMSFLTVKYWLSLTAPRGDSVTWGITCMAVQRGWGIALYNRHVPPRFDSHKYIAYRLAHIVATPGANAPDSTMVTDLLSWNSHTQGHSASCTAGVSERIDETKPKRLQSLAR
jgi:hypothetical protein